MEGAAPDRTPRARILDTTQGTSGPEDFGVVDNGQASPTVVRMLLGARLRRLRQAAGITRDSAGDAIRSSGSKISRLELGRTGFKQRDVSDLLTLYGVDGDDAERDVLLGLAAQANSADWWHEYADVLPAWFEPYLGLEQAASLIRGYEVAFIPGLLQTEDSARAVARLADGVSEAQAEQRVSLRLHRQQVLHRPDPAHLWVGVDEAALRRPIGGRARPRGRPGDHAAVRRGTAAGRGVLRAVAQRRVHEQAGRDRPLLERAEPGGHRGAAAGRERALSPPSGRPDLTAVSPIVPGQAVVRHLCLTVWSVKGRERARGWRRARG